MQTAVQAQMMMQGVVGVGGVGVGVGGMGVDEEAGILVEARQVEAVIEEGTLGMPGEEDEDDEDCDETADVEAGSGMDGSIAVMEDGTGNALNPMGEQAMMIDSNRRQRVRGISAAAGLQVPVLPVPSCRVEGCGEDLSAAGDYHRRHKVCKMHATSPKVINHGQEQRFCQQCSRFHALSEFDEGKRSCRKRLAGHNERRRRHQPDSLVTTSSESPPLLQGRESNKKGREWKSRGGRGRRGRSALSYSGRAAADGGGGGSGGDGGESISKRSLKSGEESYASIMNDAFARGDLKGKERRLAELMEKRGGEMDALDIDIPDMEQVKNGLDLGDGVVIPPLPFKRDGKPSLLKGWPQEGGIGMQVDEMEAIEQLRNTFRETQTEKSAWQHGDKETLLHCLWDCPKVQPVWRWAGRQLSKVRGSKVKVELRQGVFGAKLESWACAETVSVWRLLRGIILWQIWLARKGKISSGIEWNSGKVMRAAWVDLMMYAMQDWLEVLKKKECGKMDDAFELRGKFDSKWLVNQFAGRRAEWSMIWKDPDDVLLD